ncbi:hypothetical protein ACFQU3_24340 [Terrabacter sp. GCM10028922]
MTYSVRGPAQAHPTMAGPDAVSLAEVAWAAEPVLAASWRG